MYGKISILFSIISILMTNIVMAIGLVTILFICVNIPPLIFFNKPPEKILKPEPSTLDVALWPNNDDGQAILSQSMGNETAKRIKESYLDMPTPYFAMHPTLHYIMNKVHNSTIHIGVEGVRYLPGWKDEDVKAILQNNNRPLILLLGGSTTMGHGLRDNETIAAFLQSLVGNYADVLNFGIGAYDQIREIDLLEYLLRRGIRPTAVIFLDGLNDIFDIARSNYRWSDKIIYHGMVSGRGDVSKPDNAFSISSHASLRPSDFLAMLRQSIPIARYYSERYSRKIQPQNIKPEIDPFFDIPFDYAQQEYLFSHWAWFGDKNIELLKREALEYYNNNSNYIEGLSRAFHFKTLIFYQPIGMVDPKNPFNGKGRENLPGFTYLKEMNLFIKNQIRNNTISMIDLSDSLNSLSLKNLAYIDPAHYSPAANNQLAQIYLDYLVNERILEGH